MFKKSTFIVNNWLILWVAVNSADALLDSGAIGCGILPAMWPNETVHRYVFLGEKLD